MFGALATRSTHPNNQYSHLMLFIRFASFNFIFDSVTSCHMLIYNFPVYDIYIAFGAEKLEILVSYCLPVHSKFFPWLAICEFLLILNSGYFAAITYFDPFYHTPIPRTRFKKYNFWKRMKQKCHLYMQ